MQMTFILFIYIFSVISLDKNRTENLNDNQKFKPNKCTMINKAVSGVTSSATAGIKFTLYNYLMLKILLQGMPDFLLILFIYSLILLDKLMSEARAWNLKTLPLSICQLWADNTTTMSSLNT
jgi:hypothetical protein